MREYPNFQDVKQYLSITASNDDALLVILLKRAIKSFENLCGRTFLPTTDTRYFSADSEQVVSHNKIVLRTDDLYSVTQLKIDGQIVPTTDYWLDTRGITLKDSSEFSFKEFTDDPHNSIEITGQWDYESEVPDDVFGAIVRLTAWFYQQKDNALELDRSVAMANGMALPAGFPKDVVEASRFYRRTL